MHGVLLSCQISLLMHRLGICSWSLRPSHPEELCQRVRLAGFSAVQLALTPMVTEPEIWGETVRHLKRHSIDVLSGMLATVGEDYSSLESIARTGGIRPTEHWEANLQRARLVADCAQKHAIPLVTFHAGFLPHEPQHPERLILIDRLRMVADIFAERGVRLGLETGQEQAKTLEGVLRQLAHPNVGVNFDPANMILYGMGDPVSALTALAPWVVQVHIKDAHPTQTPGTWGTEVTAGAGAVDWPAFFDAVRALPSDVDLVVEREAGAAREGDAAVAATLVRGAFPLIA
jgi:sugar phosphate isomerase/epimerase